MATPANRVPVRIARGTKANLDTALAAGDLKEGEICYVTDEDLLYVVEGGVLVATGANLGTTSIDALADVDTTTVAPTDGQVLAWDNTAGQWEPANPTPPVGSIDDLTDVDTTTVAPTDGQVLAWDNTAGQWEPANPTPPVGSIDDLTDVDTTTSAPAVSNALLWDGTNWVPGAVSTIGRGDGGDLDLTTVDSGFVVGVYGGGDLDTTTPDVPVEMNGGVDGGEIT